MPAWTLADFPVQDPVQETDAPVRKKWSIPDLPDVPVVDRAPAANVGSRFSIPDYPVAQETAEPPVSTVPSSFPALRPKAGAAKPSTGPEYKGNLFVNFLREGGELASSIFSLLTTGLPKGLQQIFTKKEEFWEDLKTAFGPEAREQIAHELWGRYVDAWKANGAEGLLAEAHNRPLSTLLDVSFVGSAVGGATKATAKAAQMAGRLGKIPALVSAGQKAARVGSAIGKFGEVIDPLGQTTKLAGKALAKPLSYLGVGPKSSLYLGFKDQLLSAEGVKKVENLRKVVFNKLTDQEAKLLDNAIRVGAKEDIDAIRGTAAADAYNAWTDIVKTEEAALMDRPGILTKTQADLSNAEVAAEYLTKRTGQRVTTKDALAMMKSGEINPTYATLFSKRHGGIKGWFQWLVEDDSELHRASVGRKVGRFEERLAKGEFETDPRVYMARQIDLYHDNAWRMGWLDRIIHDLKKTGEIIKVKSDRTFIPKNYEIIPEAVQRKYYDVAARAGSVAVDEIQKQLAMTGKIDPKRIKAMMDSIVRSELGKSIGKAKHIAVPRHVARLIQREFALPGPLGRVYDKLLGYWKSAATVLAPTYWLPLAVSNGIMSVLAGVGLKDIARFFRGRDVLPAMLLGRSEVGLDLAGKGLYSRISNRMGEYSNMLDRTFIRGPVYSKVVRETYDELKTTGKAFFDASTTLDDFFRTVSASTDELSAIERKVQLLQEQVAQGIPRYRELAKRARKAASPFEKSAFQQEMTRIRTDVLSKLQESGALKARIPELAKYADVSEKALQAGNLFTGNYQRLHPVSRQWFRRGVPFYNFTSAMLKLAYRMPFLFPARTFMWSRFAEMVNDAVNDEQMPKWVQRIVPVWAGENGEIIGIDLNAANPWAGSSKMGEFGGATIPGIADIARQNPIVKLYMDLTGAVPSWSKRPISPGERATRLDNGQAWVFGKDGVLRPTIPQLSPAKALWSAFPFSRIIDNLLLGQSQTDRGWALSPDPILNVKGEPMQEKSLLGERLPGMLFRMSKANPAEQKRNQQLKIVGIIRSYMDDLRRAPPEKRAELLEIIKELARSWKTMPVGE